MNNRNVPDEIKAQLSIEQVVGSYLPLKKAGRIFKALCPFHGEKTPSFTVSPDRGIYKCFGCGEGGDIFDFVMKIEGLTFPEAVRLLADRAGVTMDEWKPENGSFKETGGVSKSKLFELNSYTAKLWNTILTKHPKAESARHYLRGRSLIDQTIANFQVGYAPYGNGTGQALSKAGFSRAELQAAGDPTKMQDRITFPICDLTGKVVGFTGRLLEMEDDPKGVASRGPKYWNTPETPVFAKSRTVYALHLAKHAIQDKDIAILAEGQMDVISLHQAGYTQAVASSGTALTPDQLKLIRRFSFNVAFAYDGDKAGIEATKRGIELALENDLTPYVIVIPNGKDPADCVSTNLASWHKAYEERKSYMDWLIDDLYLKDQPHPLSADSKKRLAKELLQWVGKVPSLTEQADWFRRLSAKLETSEENLRELFRRLHPRQEVSTQTENEKRGSRAQQVSTVSLAETAFAILLTFPETLPVISGQLTTFQSVKLAPLLSKLVAVMEKATESSSLEQIIEKEFTDEERKDLALASEELLQPYEGVEMDKTWAASELILILQRIRSESREQEKARIAEAIKNAQELGNTARLRELFEELQKLV